MSEDPLSLTDFSGVARLFPLPNLVLFPSVVQPLHIFEPRYRQMMADALAGDRLLAIVLLRDGWEEDYQLQPAIHPVGCVGRIHKEQRLADGRYNLLLHGLARARLVEELPTEKLYRSARVELLEDVVPADPARAMQLRRELGQHLPACFESHGGSVDQVHKLLDGPLSLGAVCDIFAFALPLAPELKQTLLEELDVARRVGQLLSAVEALSPGPGPSARSFPPPFSEN
jgi:Lon protease-like protein